MKFTIAASVFSAVAAFAVFGAGGACAETNVVDGVTYVCEGGLCRIVGARAEPTSATSRAPSAEAPRVAQGYMDAGAFVAFLENRPPADAFAGRAWGLVLLLTLLGGLALNLTPCVLPMIPVNLLVIGRSAARGAWYGLGLALAYGALGVAAAVGGIAFGAIQGSPWLDAFVCLLFVALAFASFGFFSIDLSRGRSALGRRKAALAPGVFAFLMGVVSAVLAGACVAPVLISVLLLTANLFAAGNVLALGLPFVLGLGMALPWPFLGAGLQILPKPGAWMKTVSRIFALLVAGLAVRYGCLAWRGFAGDAGRESRDAALAATPETFDRRLSALKSKSARPVLVDCWASWCKSCAAMERVMDEPSVRKALGAYDVIRLQAEDINALRRLKDFESVRGLPAFVILGEK